jgi:hypothetical protein
MTSKEEPTPTRWLNAKAYGKHKASIGVFNLL